MKEEKNTRMIMRGNHIQNILLKWNGFLPLLLICLSLIVSLIYDYSLSLFSLLERILWKEKELLSDSCYNNKREIDKKTC